MTLHRLLPIDRASALRSRLVEGVEPRIVVPGLLKLGQVPQAEVSVTEEALRVLDAQGVEFRTGESTNTGMLAPILGRITQEMRLVTIRKAGQGNWPLVGIITGCDFSQPPPRITVKTDDNTTINFPVSGIEELRVARTNEQTWKQMAELVLAGQKAGLQTALLLPTRN